MRAQRGHRGGGVLGRFAGCGVRHSQLQDVVAGCFRREREHRGVPEYVARVIHGTPRRLVYRPFKAQPLLAAIGQARLAGIQQDLASLLKHRRTGIRVRRRPARLHHHNGVGNCGAGVCLQARDTNHELRNTARVFRYVERVSTGPLHHKIRNVRIAGRDGEPLGIDGRFGTDRIHRQSKPRAHDCSCRGNSGQVEIQDRSLLLPLDLENRTRPRIDSDSRSPPEGRGRRHHQSQNVAQALVPAASRLIGTRVETSLDPAA